MEEGFLKDEGYGAKHVSTWIAGAPERSVWTVTKTRGRLQIKVRTYRCAQCGFLESYAPAVPVDPPA